MKQENLLNKLFICNLYQTDSDDGYFRRDAVCTNDDVEKVLKNSRRVHQVGRVIVERSFFNRFQLKEIITGIPIDTLYERTTNKKGLRFIWDRNWIAGAKNRYHSFIVVPIWNCTPTAEQIDKYAEAHPDALEYKKGLTTLLGIGEAGYNAKIQEAIDKANATNEKVKTLLNKRNSL